MNKISRPAPSPEDAQTLAQAQLREAGVRATPARINVMASLLGARSAVSHQDLQDCFVGMDRVTLYRALDCLTEAGLAHKIASDDRIFRYSAGAEHGETPHPQHAGEALHQHQHGHFKCTRCSRVFCLDETGEAGFLESVLPASGPHQSAAQHLQTALENTLGQGFRSMEVELTIKGWCADCAR
ncbi:transcriptional repressor [Herbaspirillum sp. RTI4]|uniref:Fur family transcriptional regulator n=1 Tax=Herbaspirillum sp. RTI4 TaxID=3048640 RepID=UPI002AB4B0C3|nr:transcriptional repressor [Herbaspirillum sp. RTI4]MDY7576931.1 transcriptional repressor [Herbaspirillum sp. RTI4]MEA9983198.1 transcriptional repressor [Herbaspirillum sp. RTI4]